MKTSLESASVLKNTGLLRVLVVMGKYTGEGGAWRTCPICGKQFFVTLSDDWCYKRIKREGTSGVTVWFDKWSCMRIFDRERKEELKAKRAKATKRIKPVKHVKTRYTRNYCGRCGRTISFGDDRCEHCKAYIDWN